jgi:superfamily II DNA or RNA helicase
MGLSKIVDNASSLLRDALSSKLKHSRAVDICVGYFNIRGWNQVSEGLDSLRRESEAGAIRLLVGMAVPEKTAEQKLLEATFRSESGEEDIDYKIATRRALDAVQEFSEQLTWGLPSDAAARAIRDFLADVKSGVVTVKFAARRRLHAKLYLCHMDGGAGGFTAFVGSSNFTSSGLQGSGELNLEETDQEKGEELAEWFTSHWDDLFSIDVTQELIEVLENSWAAVPNPSPRSVHLRIAYELSRDARNGEGLEIPNKILERLVPWQEAAAKVGARILATRGLVVVGDVVGLGKTIVGTAIAASSQERTLIICPKNLKKMWQQYVETYELHARVVSLSMVTKELPEMKHYGVVLVDESHNLRHSTTQAYEAVKNYIHENGSRVILLTATMINASEMDISGQLALKLDPNMDLGIRPENYIEALSAPDLIKFQEKVSGNVSSLKAFEQSKYTDDWRRLLSMFLVRRTRPYLLEHYAKQDPSGKKYFEYRDGTRFHFPERKALPLEYPGGVDDPCDQLASIQNFDAISGMTYARYQLGQYFSEDFAPQTAEEEVLFDDLQRATASKGFIETTVLKRLASSPKAFFITVEKMLLRAHILRFALENELPIPIGTIADKYYVDDLEDEDINFDDLDGSEEGSNSDGSWAKGLTTDDWNARAKNAYEALTANKPKHLKLVRHDIFKRDALMADVLADNRTLQTIIDEHGAWDPANDSKLNKLVDLISELEPNQKLLVFSEYADSISYLEKHLKARLPKVALGAVSGRSSDPTYMARCFSPESNKAELGGLPDGEEELQVLLATDVLSEGQNLQDAAMILNWDLPWTIIKIIQRAGRVDRVGQKSETIKVFSFKPHNGVEAHLELLKRLRQRLELNQSILGGGETIFADHIEDSLEDLFDGKAALMADEGDVDYASHALALWNKASEEERGRALALGKGSHSSMVSESPMQEPGVISFAQATKGEDQIFDLFAIRTSDSKVRTLTQMEALKLTENNQNVSADDLADHHELVAEIVKGTLYPQAAQKPLRINVGPRKKLLNFFDASISELELDDTIRLESNLLHSKAIDHALLKAGETLVNQVLLRLAKGFITPRDALLEFIESNKLGNLLDTENQGLRKFELMVSLGTLEKA